MDIFTEDDFRNIVSIQHPYCISIFMPFFRAGAEIQQNPIRFKNLLSEAEKILVKKGKRATEASWMLTSAKRFLNFHSFWQYDASGLAAFIAPGIIKVFRTPSSFHETIMIGEHFYIRPILPMVTSHMKYYMLDLNLSGVRLYTGSRYLFSRIESETLPGPIENVLLSDFNEKHTQFYGKSQPGDSEIPVIYGYGHDTDNQTRRIKEYFNIVNSTVTALLNKTNAPLITAGVEYLHPIYNNVNSYPHLLEKGIHLDISLFTEQQMHESSLELVRPFYATRKQYDKEQFRMLAGKKSSIAVNDLQSIVAGAHHGRVNTLFLVNTSVAIWGQLQKSDQQVIVHDHQLPGDDELIERAAVDTLLRGGSVHVLDREEMPDENDVAAIMRY
ncbi:MAG TPA: hypothetical protein VHO70_08270 [Chitinispirillaceae bacterium]|nr:hypothetical protein [Chitinispirillaceae bacterium]